MGQPFFAFVAAVSNASRLAPGTFALTSRCTAVTVKPMSSFTIVTVAVVAMRSAFRFTAPSCPENAIEKQPACAAATSSSGFVPGASSKRMLKV